MRPVLFLLFPALLLGCTPPGNSGASPGAAGTTGTGATGAAGTTGIGATGAAGTTGIGATGAAGTTGTTATGAAGTTGTTATGAAGTTGTTATGATGAAGSGSSTSNKTDAASSGAQPSLPAKYTVTFEIQDTTNDVPVPVEVLEGEKVTRPTSDPTHNGDQIFVNWYASSAKDSAPFDFDTEITGDTTIYGKWGYTVTFDVKKHTINAWADGGKDKSTRYYTRAVVDGETIAQSDAPPDAAFILPGYTFGFKWVREDDATFIKPDGSQRERRSDEYTDFLFGPSGTIVRGNMTVYGAYPTLARP